MGSRDVSGLCLSLICYSTNRTVLFTLKYCTRTRISCTSQPDRMMKETRLESRRTPKPMDAELSVSGVRFTEMNRDTLREHVRDMRLKPKGPLKADLQRCLWYHLRRSSCNDGIDKGGESGAKKREGRFGDGAGMDEAGAEVEDGNEAESVEPDKKVQLHRQRRPSRSTRIVHKHPKPTRRTQRP